MNHQALSSFIWSVADLLRKFDPDTVTFEDGFSRDVSQVGHWGTGDVELCIRTATGLERAGPLLERCYAENDAQSAAVRLATQPEFGDIRSSRIANIAARWNSNPRICWYC